MPNFSLLFCTVETRLPAGHPTSTWQTSGSSRWLSAACLTPLAACKELMITIITIIIY